jgi:prevent-host-death family protein
MKLDFQQARSQLSKLLRRVEAGEEITIERAGEPVARLVRAESPNVTRPMGMDRGSVYIADDFDAALRFGLSAEFHGRKNSRRNRRRK